MNDSTALRRDPTRKNVLLLALCQALAMSGSSLIATVSALAGYLLAEDKSLATLPVACQFLGTMLTTVPASLIMRRIGRRAGFILGQVIGLIAVSIACYAIFQGTFTLFVVAAALFGAHVAFWQYYRFAAADTASEAYRGRSISYVLAGGVLAAVVGPELAKLSIDLFDPVQFAGGYVAVMMLIVCAVIVLQFLDIPTLSVARQKNTGRPLRVIAAQPVFIVAVVSAMLGYASMALVMTATPLAMARHGHDFADTALVIQWHILGMFAPSFFSGYLIDRFGVLNIITAGVGAMVAAVLVSITGTQLVQYWATLVLVGVGWNFMFVGGSTLLTQCYRVEERAKVQALNDFLVFSTAALASFPPAPSCTAPVGSGLQWQSPVRWRLSWR
jgi:MFS family permease